MSIEQKIALVEKQDINLFLQRLGYQPEKQRSKDTWYKIRRGESLASFHVSDATIKPGLKHVCYDFGASDFNGGTIINLAAWLTGKTLSGEQFLEVIEYILGVMGGSKVVETPGSLQKSAKASKETPTDRYLLDKTIDISSSKIFEYLMGERGLSKIVVNTHLRQVHFSDTLTGRQLFAPGIKNVAGGYEVSHKLNGKFKSAIPSSSKSLSFIKSPAPASDRVYLFEGFMDALSYLTHLNMDREVQTRHFQHDVLILNGAALKKYAFEFIQKSGYKTILGFLDNDKTGDKLKEEFKDEFGARFKDFSHVYLKHKDYNAFLLSLKKSDNI